MICPAAPCGRFASIGPLTECASGEYGQGIHCLLHLPRGDPRRGGECGKESLGVVACREVKRPVGQIGGEPPRSGQKPHQNPRFGTSTKIEGYSEQRAHGSGCPPVTMLYSTGHHHLQPAPSKKELYGPAGHLSQPAPYNQLLGRSLWLKMALKRNDHNAET